MSLQNTELEWNFKGQIALRTLNNKVPCSADLFFFFYEKSQAEADAHLGQDSIIPWKLRSDDLSSGFEPGDSIIELILQHSSNNQYFLLDSHLAIENALADILLS